MESNPKVFLRSLAALCGTPHPRGGNVGGRAARAQPRRSRQGHGGDGGIPVEHGATSTVRPSAVPSALTAEFPLACPVPVAATHAGPRSQDTDSPVPETATGPVAVSPPVVARRGGGHAGAALSPRHFRSAVASPATLAATTPRACPRTLTATTPFASPVSDASTRGSADPPAGDGPTSTPSRTRSADAPGARTIDTATTIDAALAKGNTQRSAPGASRVHNPRVRPNRSLG